MAKMIFVSLPVADVARATAFYAALGFEQDPAFSGAQASSMRWSDSIVVMLADHALFATLTTKRIVDPRTDTGALLALSFDNRAAVDAITATALAAGGREVHEAEDLGFMYSRAFEDPDGHCWGPMFLDIAAHAEATADAAARPAAQTAAA